MKKHIKTLLHKTKKLQKKVQNMGAKPVKKTKKRVIPPKAEKVERVIVELSMGSVAKATLLIILLYVLAQFLASIQQILILFFVAVFLSAALDPTVDKLQEKKINN